MKKDKKKLFQETVDDEILKKGKNIVKDFDESAEIFVPARKRKNKLISIRFPIAMIRELRRVSTQKGDIGYQQVLKAYIAEGLSREKGCETVNFRQPLIQHHYHIINYVTSGPRSGLLSLDRPEEGRSLSTQLVRDTSHIGGR